MGNQEQRHVRRVRYRRTHPRTYQEKYKELQPGRYKDTVGKMIQRGSTSTGIRISICVNEILEFLQTQPGQRGLDATLRYGGHTQAMLECLKSEGHLSVLGMDPVEPEKTRERLAKLGYGPEILTIRRMNFADIDKLVAEIGPFDFMMADLSVSSVQTDNPDRGFSYRTEGPLDLRLNPAKGETAAERLRTITLEELQGMLLENAGEPYAEEIVKEVITTIKRSDRIDITAGLRRVIERALPFLPSGSAGTKKAVKKSCQRTFQALRIDVNNESEALYDFLEKLPNALAPDSRVTVLTFHSGEGHLIKKSFKQFRSASVYSNISTDVIRPSAEERNRNPRVHSTKMRWAVRVWV